MLSILSFIAAVFLATGAVAQKPASEEDHAAHHPDGASAPAAAVKKPQAKPKAAQPAKPKASAAAASSSAGMGMGMGTGMGMGGDMAKMREEAHKPGGMHDQMHGKDGKMMGMGGGAMPAASAASQ